MKINEKLREFKTPILLFIFGSILGLGIGFVIHEAIHNQDEWKDRLGRKREALNSDDETDDLPDDTNAEFVPPKNEEGVGSGWTTYNA